MTAKVRLKQFLQVHALPGEGVYLLSEHGQTVLRGELAEKLVPLLNGDFDRAELEEMLSPAFGAGKTSEAINRLIEAGHAVEAGPEMQPRAAGYWEMAGLTVDHAIRSTTARRISVQALGCTEANWLTNPACLAGLEVTAEADAELTVVLTDDYSSHELADMNRAALKSGRSWLLAKPVGTEIWVGPLFAPGTTGCWQCLATRLESHYMAASYLRHRAPMPSMPSTAVADLPTTIAMACHLTCMVALQWFADFHTTELVHHGQEPDHTPCLGPGEILTLNTLTLRTRVHSPGRRPQCAVCGDSALQAQSQWRPIVLASRPKQLGIRGGHRAKRPEDLLAQYERFVSPVIGPVRHLVKARMPTEDLHCYWSGYNSGTPARDLGGLRSGLRSLTGGKGATDVEARAGALAEALERHSGCFQGDEARISARFTELGPEAIEPNTVSLFSAAQYTGRAEWNRRCPALDRVTDPFDPHAVIDWTPVWSLTANRRMFLPTASLFYHYQDRSGRQYPWADSNGCAAGASLEDAALQGFFELVERDAVAIWWYNMLRMPRMDLGRFHDPYIIRWQEAHAALGRETWTLDLTTDLGVLVVAALSRRTGGSAEDIVLGFGAHFDPRTAVIRALTEVDQNLPFVLARRNGSLTGNPIDQDHHLIDWLEQARTEQHPFLLPAPQTPRTAADHSDRSSPDLLDDLHLAQQIVQEAGLELLMLNQTRPDIGLPVVKAIVPGLRHFRRRMAPGRLYDVPVRMGRIAAPRIESEMNQVDFFL